MPFPRLLELFDKKLAEISMQGFKRDLQEVKVATKNTFTLKAQKPSDIVLHGRFMWQLDGDPDDDQSLVDTVANDDIVRCANTILTSARRKLFIVKY